MNKNQIIEAIKGGLIISCQALETEPLYSSFIMSRMAVAAMQEGAVGIRANTVVDIEAIKQAVSLPMIGIIKKVYDDSEVYITPTEVEVEALIEIGVEIIAIDATNRLRTGGRTLEEIFIPLKAKYPNQLFMADCSCYDDCVNAEKIGFDFVGTTLVGYTKATKGQKLPATDLIVELKKTLNIPIIAEGGIHYPKQLKEVMDSGCHCAVVGGAITRPQEIARRFINEIK